MKTENNYPPVQSSSEIRALIASFRQSGLSVGRFARKHRIPAGRLHYWLYQKYRPRKAEPSWNDPGKDPAPVFQEMKLDPSTLIGSWAAEVNIDSKLNLRFSATADAAWIGAVIQAVRRPC